MDLKAVILVGAGSFLGGVLRYGTIFWIERKADSNFPWGVLAANALGSFLIGLLLPWYAKFGWGRDDAMPLLLSVGVLGGYTTFSTFSLQTLRLLQSGHLGLAALNATLSFAACLLTVYLGWKLGELVWS